MDVEEIMQRVYAEVVTNHKSSTDEKNDVVINAQHQKKNSAQMTSCDQDNSSATNKTKEKVDQKYSIDQLCHYNDIDFIKNVYRIILHREASEEEIDNWLFRMRTSYLTKKEVLAQVRFGPEGRQKKVSIKNLYLLSVFYRLRNMPIIGRFIRVVSCIIHLPVLFSNVQGIKYNFDLHLKKSEERSAKVNIHLDYIENKGQIMLSSLSQKADRESVSILYNSLQETEARLQSMLEKVNAKMTDFARLTRDNKFHVLAQQRRFDDFLLQGQQFTRVTGGKSIGLKKIERNHNLDVMYVALENRFRGTREEIKERQRVYLPYVEEVQLKIGHVSVLDVGCGRGEWLELLREKEYSAKGIDINRMMVTQTRDLGLDVEEGDIFDYFTDIAPESLSVVTGFHIVEHLPLETMIALFDQSYRAIKPGGMAIFETPNPENIIVGSCNFYYDPTHKNPIPPALLSFLLEEQGFQNVEIVRLHENSYYSDLKGTGSYNKITSLFYGAQDYSVICYKQ